MNRSFMPPPKKYTSSKGKKKSSGGGGGSLDVGELMKDKRILGGVGGVLLIVLLYFGWGMLPEGSGKLVTAHGEFVKIAKQVKDTVKSNPSEKDWKDFTTAVKKELDAAYKPIALSKHKAKMPISRCKTAIRTVLSKKTPKEADEKLDDVEKKLSAAKKALGISRRREQSSAPRMVCAHNPRVGGRTKGVLRSKTGGGHATF